MDRKYVFNCNWKPIVRAKQFKCMKSLVWGFKDSRMRIAKGRRLRHISHHYAKY